MKLNRKISLAGLLFAFAFMLAGCEDIPDAKPTTGRNPTVAEVPNANETVRGEEDPAIVTLDLGNMLHERRLSGGEDLPGRIIIPTTNLNAVPITAALQAILTGTDISLSWDTGALGNRLVTVMNVSGPLPQVVDKICSAAKVFCNYRHGSLELSEQETFVVSLPPVMKSGSSTSAAAGSTNTMVETIGQLVGTKVQVDDQGGNVIYVADVTAENRVHLYLEQLRNGRPLIVLQLYVWEVVLNKENAAGINWTQFAVNGINAFGTGFGSLALSGASSFTSLSNTTGNVGIGAITTGGKVDTNSLLSFLATQGRVQTISSPQVTFVSGSGASLKIGGTQRYISQVGTNTANVSGTGTSTATDTISTDNIDTGLSVDVDGAFESGVVYANLALSLKNLVSLNPTTTAGTTIDLPSTTDQKINTAIRVRPGDNLIMAGLVSSSDTQTTQGVPTPFGTLPGYGDNQLLNHELVVVVKPSVVMFTDKGSEKKELHDKPYENNKAPDALVIDKDGTQALALPNGAPGPNLAATPVSIGGESLPAPVKPELMIAAPNATSTAPIPITPSDDGAPVDRRLMQRGFSHAFDELLQTPTTTVSANGGASP